MKGKGLWLTLLILLLTGCGAVTGQMPSGENTVVFYYCNVLETDRSEPYSGNTGALGTESWEADNATVEQILERYVQGPVSPELRTPFPADLTVETCSVDSGVLTVFFGKSWQNLAGLDKTLAQACLVHTATQLPEIEAVRIRCAGDTDGALLSRDDFLLLDEAPMEGDE